MKPEIQRIMMQIKKVIVGKELVIEKMLMAILAGGHILIDDVPGVGKTTLALSFSKALELPFQRIQFTPDVLPSDISGYTIYDQHSGSFVYRPGAITHAGLVLADEINRASGKVQSALLEAMEERQITVDGRTYPLPEPFLVIATQNRVGTSGTQPLPFAQMDRFLIQLKVGYPDHEAQMQMLRDRQTSNPIQEVRSVISREELLHLQAQCARVMTGEAVIDYITRLSEVSRNHEMIEVGISPRGALLLNRMAKSRAFMMDRDYVTGEDVREVFADVCAHRIRMNSRGRSGDVKERQVLEDILSRTECPDLRSIR